MAKKCHTLTLHDGEADIRESLHSQVTIAATAEESACQTANYGSFERATRDSVDRNMETDPIHFEKRG